MPFLNKDGLKESLFETLGWSDLDWSRRLGTASMVLLFHVAERPLAAGVSTVIEANFHAELSCLELKTLQQRHDARACQVQCVGDGDVFDFATLDIGALAHAIADTLTVNDQR